MNDFVDQSIIEISGNIAKHRVLLTELGDKVNGQGTVEDCRALKGEIWEKSQTMKTAWLVLSMGLNKF